MECGAPFLFFFCITRLRLIVQLFVPNIKEELMLILVVDNLLGGFAGATGTAQRNAERRERGVTKHPQLFPCALISLGDTRETRGENVATERVRSSTLASPQFRA